MIISGNPVNAVAGNKLGICDLVISAKLNEQDRLNAAIDFILSKNGVIRPINKLPIPDADVAMSKLDGISFYILIILIILIIIFN